jgi:hypothetical protein
VSVWTGLKQLRIESGGHTVIVYIFCSTVCVCVCMWCVCVVWVGGCCVWVGEWIFLCLYIDIYIYIKTFI